MRKLISGFLFLLTTLPALAQIPGGVQQFGTVAADDCVKWKQPGVIQSAGAVCASGAGSVTSVSFTGGIVSVATPTTTPAFTIAGTSGGIPYFDSASTWASSGVLVTGRIVLGGGIGGSPTTTLTGTGVVTALGVATGSAGSFLVNTQGYTLTGTAAQIYTFPTTSAALARTDAGQTFTGVNTFTSPNFLTSVTYNTTTITTFPAAATYQFGDVDNDLASAVVAQNVLTQGLLTGGTSNQAGKNFTIGVSPGKGTGAGGSFIVQVAAAGSTGSTRNALATALTIDSTKLATFAGDVASSNFYVGAAIGMKNNGGTVLIAAGGPGTNGWEVTNIAVYTQSTGTIGWSNGTASGGTLDTAFSRLSATNVAIGNSTAGDFSGGLKLTNLTINRAATFLTTSVALTDGVGASAGTITNAPSIGNPTKWIGINDNGTTRYIPAW